MPAKSASSQRYPVGKDYPLLLVILLLATFLRFHGLNEPGLWLDEISYSIAAQRPLIDQVLRPTETLGNYLSVDPTLSAIPFSLSLRVGTSNFLVRLPAALFGILGVALIYKLGRTLFDNQVGYLAAFLLSISSFHILYSQEARSYSQFVFFSMASFLFLYQAILTSRLSNWTLYTFSTWAAVSTNHLMIFAVAVQGLFLGIAFLRDQFFTGELSTRRLISLRTFGYFTLSLIVVFLLRIPWLGDFTQRPCAGCRLGNFSAPFHLVTHLDRWLQALVGETTFGLIILAGLGLLGLVLALAQFRLNGLLLTCWLIASPLITIAGLWLISQFFHERYTIWGLPAFLILVAYGLAEVSRWVRGILLNLIPSGASSQALKAAPIGGVGLLLGGLLLTNLYQIQQETLLKQGWPLGRIQEVATLITTQASPDEVIIPIKVSALHLQFFTQQSRPELAYFSSSIFGEGLSPDKLEEELQGRWYIIHNTGYTTPNRPNEWLDSPDYKEFHDLIVVHLTTPCPFKQCIQETQTLLEQLAAANPKSHFATGMEEIVAKLKLLGF